VQRQNNNALALAKWCVSRPEFSQVHYPGLASHPDYEIAQECLDGFGGMLSVELAGGVPAAERFVAALQVVTRAPSFGGVDSLVCEPRFTSHANLTADERREIGIPDGFVRFSIGIEDVDDLIIDFEQALR
jgi:cystathionine beta-lyase/cystathionine gamma-synthase